MNLPFSPRRTLALRVLPLVLALICPLGLFALTLLVSAKRQDWLGWTASWFVVLLVSFASWLVGYEKLIFGSKGIERVSGLRRHHIAYSAIKTIKLKLVPVRYGPSPVVFIGVSPGTPPTEVWLLSYEANDRREMLQLLAQQTPDALWDDNALNYLHLR